MKFPLIKGQRWPTILILILFGLPIVLTGIFALSFPSLAAPPKPIPMLNYQESQMLTYNTVTKAKAAFLTMFQTGTGRGPIELSEAEVNALLSQGLSQGLKGDYKFVGSITTLENNHIYVEIALDWQGHPLGLQLVLSPQAVGGDVLLTLEDAHLGRIPLPSSLLSRYLELYLPQGFLLEQHPLRLTYDPDVLVNQVSLPLVKNPGLAIERLGIDNHTLRLTALLSFRLGF
jgi:uncharacterized protein YpmS